MAICTICQSVVGLHLYEREMGNMPAKQQEEMCLPNCCNKFVAALIKCGHARGARLPFDM